MAVQVLTDADFETSVLGATGTVVVEFWATWCGPCKQLAPVLEKLSEKYADGVTWYKVDVDGNPDIVRNFEVSGTPTTLVFKGGDMVYSVVGAKPMAILEKELSTFL